GAAGGGHGAGRGRRPQGRLGRRRGGRQRPHRAGRRPGARQPRTRPGDRRRGRAGAIGHRVRPDAGRGLPEAARRQAMNWRNVATIATKALGILVARRSVRLSLILLPLGVAIGLPQVARFAGNGGIPAALVPRVLTAFLFFFAVPPTVLPVPLPSYSLVGGEIQPSLAPLLATPAAPHEIRVG